MAHNEDEETNTPKENDWEEVSLTASAYAAAPGPKLVDSSQDSQVKLGEEHEAETSCAMFMSTHFNVFPPSQYETLPVRPEYSEIHNAKEVEDDVSQSVEKEIHKLDMKGDENVSIEGLISDKEQSIYSTTELSSFHSEMTMDKSSTVEGGDDLIEPPDQSLDPVSPNYSKLVDGNKHNAADLPCKAWWKRQAVSLYDHAKEANTFWSICIAAAVTGIVIIGHQWQKLHLKGPFVSNDERIAKMFSPISRFKDAVVGGNRRGWFVHGSTSREH